MNLTKIDHKYLNHHALKKDCEITGHVLLSVFRSLYGLFYQSLSASNLLGYLMWHLAGHIKGHLECHPLELLWSSPVSFGGIEL